MKLQNILDLSTFEITRFRIWNQTSQPSDKGLGSKYFNTNSGHEAYGREQIYTPIGWRTAAYMDDIEAINEKLDLIFGDEIDTDTIIDSWKEVQDFLAGIEDTTTLITLLDDKLSKTGGGIILGNGAYAPLIVNADEGQTGVGFRLQVKGENKALLAWDNNEGAYIYNSVAKRYIGVLDSGTPYYHDGSQYRTLVHAGNVENYNAGSATKLKDTIYLWGNAFDGTQSLRKNIIIDNDSALYFRDTQNRYVNAVYFDSTEKFYVGYGVARNSYDTYIEGYNIYLRYGNAPTVGFVLNSSGNVGIGAITPQYKLDVAGDAGFSGLANLNGGALIPTGKNMMFGDASGNAIVEYDEDAGAIKITGSVYATGTVASGGKAQAGSGTGGSATVYPFTLTYGQAAYQIANPKSNTNVIVQVYEWNATTSSWDLILTDVNVTASKITVTFGRTTTVNHMVTVV